jgi:hypothetical protein
LATFLPLRSAIAPSHSAGGLGHLGADAREHRRYARADVADHRRVDAHVAVGLLGPDVDLDEPLPPPVLGALAAPGLALAVREQPVEARADQHHDVGFGQRERAGGGGTLLVGVGKQALGHRHGQVGDPGLLDQRPDIRIGLRIGRALAEDDERLLRALQQVQGALHGLGRGNLPWRRIDDLDERLPAGFRVQGLREELARQVEVDAAWPAGHGGANGARDAHADVLGVQHAVSGLGERPGDGELVHLLVVALLQVDDLALARAADQDHREAVGGRMGKRVQAVQEARGGHRETDARLLGKEAGDGRGVAGVLLVAERQHAQALGLCTTGQVGDRNAGQTEDRVDAVQFQGIDDQLKAVGHWRLRFVGDLRFGGAHDGLLEGNGMVRSAPRRGP